ncbi:NAD-dependent epimerase/dehydratase family protein [Nannocystaceae bacterium ST9]
MSLFSITGASGRLGNVLVRHLLARGDRVRVLVMPGDPQAGSLAGLDIERIEGSVLDRRSLDGLVEGADGVFHLAALIDLGSDRQGRVWSVNVEGTTNVVAACQAASVRMVHCSSHAALQRWPLEQPLDELRPLALDEKCPYHRAKAHAELRVHEAVAAGLDAVVCSPATLTGPFDFAPSLFGGALIDLYRGKIPILLDVVCDYADTRDVVDAMITAMAKGRKGERYLLSGQVLDMLELTAILQDVTGRAMPKRSLPLWVGWAALPFSLAIGALTGKPPVFTAGVLRAAVFNRVVLHDKAAAELDFHPRTMRESLPDTIEWFRGRGWLD